MLLVHQAGTVKIGEVVRYTLTYTPSHDRILPTPSHLHLKVKNTSAIPLRAAWIHGPYALHVSQYPASFNPHCKVEEPKRYGVPEYEPMLKAAGSWQSKLTVPEDIRETGADLGKRRQSVNSQGERHDGDNQPGSVTWIIEIASQILFSSSAGVDFEILVGRDERSLDLGITSTSVAGQGHGGPGQIKDVEKHRQRNRGDHSQHHHHQTAGVYSRAVRLIVEDTEALWNKPGMPTWDDKHNDKSTSKHSTTASDPKDQDDQGKKRQKRKKLHLVIVTHGLHSNVGADMLFMKESIDATVKQARLDARERKRKYRAQEKEKAREDESGSPSKAEGEGGNAQDDVAATAPLSGGQEEIHGEDDDDDEEETIVRGFSGNAARTENGIQYLGKRLAKYILKLTYPDQPFLPVKKPLSRTFTDSFKSQATKAQRDGAPAHQGSSVHHSKEQKQQAEQLPYTFSSISFIGHSLGGLIQTYAVAYIQKHSPTFFENIEPVNFICMASPMLGLSNENPLYVKFALDFGLVGRTGQDLGLTWKPPGLATAKGGWNAMLGGLGGSTQKDDHQADPGSKPLLRILPTGPAHQVLRKFRNRTLYSNVVNDGIVPLRTSCLLFLDWRGLGKVDKARRENGLVGTAAGWAWAELTGANSSSVPPNVLAEQNPESDSDTDLARRAGGDTVPQPAEDETAEDSRKVTGRMSIDSDSTAQSKPQSGKEPQQQKGVLDSFFDFFRPAQSPTPPRGKSPQPPTSQPQLSKKTSKTLSRAQTVRAGHDQLPDDVAKGMEGTTANPTMRPQANDKSAKRPVATKGDSFLNSETGELQAPPKTSIFESAGDILHPPLPSKQWITDPSSRARTIFHDRVYHPEDIPPPPLKRPGSRLGRTFSSDNMSKSGASDRNSMHSVESVASIDSSNMKVEEKIARAYHKDLSWRKVLVRLEPDAHNNMIVRRQFANAYGWPVIKHLCDTHFADTYSARTRDEAEPAKERAPPRKEPIDSQRGEEVYDQSRQAPPPRTNSETREAQDELTALSASHQSSTSVKRLSNTGSGVWDDAVFEGPDDDDSEIDERGLIQRLVSPGALKKPEQSYQPSSRSNGAPRSPSIQYVDGHRGLAPVSPTSSKPKATQGAESGSLRSRASLKTNVEPEDLEPPVVSGSLVEEPEQMEQSTTDVGLGKTVHEQVGSSPKKAKTKESARKVSVAEDVARASSNAPQE
ncbi:hypothetical protein WHR41_02318 [Cladosporium halotolerans]|uniref:DUF676 domain-containing protein n=1 Tax=Cladosporium halotolerans TaxID=1052096 RepID=A0AB34L053_9PEZI